ncbi:MAG TPA: GAF domain-containing sensor histidine kinase [Candidatus Cloacimonetes bacterium]|nr:GAF domain-containing sensor histidine kinase [Candidatus Cloacimonadota bacterium]
MDKRKMKSDRIEKLEKILELNKLLNHTNDFSELLNIILQETEKMFLAEGTSILLEDKETGELHFHICTGEKKEQLLSLRMDKGEGVCGYVFETGKSLVENNPEESKLFSHRVDKESSFITRNLLCVPLEIKGKTIGVIELVNKIEGNFTEGDVDFLTAIASQVSITLERARLVEEMIKSERLASIGETVAGLSHCIKNILNGLKGGAYILNKNLQKIDSPKMKIGFEMVQKNIEKISSLVLDMLEYSKERKPEYELSNINSIIDDVIELVAAKAEANNISIIKNFQKGLQEIEIDPKGIFRCILNLAGNSIDALTDTDNARLEFITKKENKFVIIEIKDNGCGIKKELQKKLFTKFFSTKGSKGTGFGLPVTKKIINEHKGTIKCVSRENAGTTFSIKLPFSA